MTGGREVSSDMDREMLELYSDYLLASFGQTSATRLSQLLEWRWFLVGPGTVHHQP